MVILKPVGKKVDFMPIEEEAILYVTPHISYKLLMALFRGQKLGRTVGKESGIRNFTLATSTIGVELVGIGNGKKVISGILIGTTIE